MSENDIIQGCLKNDPRYQRLLVANFSSMLLTVSRRYCPANIGAEDVLQDAFIKIFGKIKQYNPEKGNLAGWMRKIVINTALKKMKKRSYTHEQSTDEFEDIQLQPSVYQHLEAEAIIALISELPEGLRQVFNLHAVEGYSHREIAEIMGYEEGTSRSNLFRAKQILRTKLSNQKQQESWARIG
jgi:RNA polymerase sigma factor (sigma-70 family)